MFDAVGRPAARSQSSAVIAPQVTHAIVGRLEAVDRVRGVGEARVGDPGARAAVRARVVAAQRELPHHVRRKRLLLDDVQPAAVAAVGHGAGGGVALIHASGYCESRAPLTMIQELLGHATIMMTMRYAHLAPEIARDAVRLLDGLADRRKTVVKQPQFS
jgi:hypothetical protein